MSHFDAAEYERAQRADQILARTRALQREAEWTPLRLLLVAMGVFIAVLCLLYLGLVWRAEDPDLIFTWRGLKRAALTGAGIGAFVWVCAWVEHAVKGGRGRG